MAGDAPGPAAEGHVQPADPVAPIALYRRYRPATFAEVRGQDHVTEPLRQALRSGRVHHAYLFSGPRGCGKTSSARILARSLNCEQGPTPDPCGVCASCVSLAPSGPGSIDVIEIDAASHGGVDDARDLRERAFYAPVSGRFKIYIVDEAHMVTREGFNALLKLVEEPPPHLKFVFATTEPEKVIATIRSRTHHYPFRLMPPTVLRGLIEEILASEAVPYEPAVLPVVIRAGAGSARDALSVLDQLVAGSDETGLSYENAVALLGYTDDSLLDEVTDAFAAGDGAAVFHAVDRLVEAGHDPRRFATDLLDRLRDLIVLAAVPDAGQTGLLDVPADRLERMRKQAESTGQAQLTRAAEVISAGLVEMRGATSPRLLLELMCAQVLLPAPDVKEQKLTARLERLEQRIGTGTVQDIAPRITPADTAPPADSGRSRVTGDGPPSSPGSGSIPRPGDRARSGTNTARDTGAPDQEASGGSPNRRTANGGAANGGTASGRAASGGTASRATANGGAADDSAANGGAGADSLAAGPTGGGTASGGPGTGGDGAGRGGTTRDSSARDSSARDSSARDSSARDSAADGSPASGSAAGSSAADGGSARGSSARDGSGRDGAPAGAGITEQWDAILDGVKDERKVSWILLRAASVESFRDGVLTLSFPREGDAKGFTAGGHDHGLSVVLERMLGITPQIRAIYEPPGGAPAARSMTGPTDQGGDWGAETGGRGGSPARAGGAGSRGAGSRDAGSSGGGSAGADSTGAGARRAGARGDDAGSGEADPYGGGSYGGGSAGPDPQDAGPAGGSHGGPGEGSGDRPGASQQPQRGASGPGSGDRGASRRDSSAAAAGGGHGAPGGRAGRSAAGGGKPAAGRGRAQAQADDGGHAEDDADADGDVLIGADLIERELGGRVIEETGG